MQNKIIRDVNFILALLKERKDIFDVLFGNEGNKPGNIYISPQSVFPCLYDYMYKTTWLLDIVDQEEYTFGVIASGEIISHMRKDAYLERFCTSLQDFPAQRFLNFCIGDTKEEIYEYFAVHNYFFSGDWFKLLEEYVKICESNDIQLHSVYQKILQGDFSDKDAMTIFSIREPDNWMNEQDDPAYGEMVFVNGSAPIGQKYLPVIERKIFKPVEKLYMPRILQANESYTEVPLVEHMVDGNDMTQDETFIQE